MKLFSIITIAFYVPTSNVWDSNVSTSLSLFVNFVHNFVFLWACGAVYVHVCDSCLLGGCKWWLIRAVKKELFITFIYYMYVCMHVCGGACLPQHTCGDQRTA